MIPRSSDGARPLVVVSRPSLPGHGIDSLREHFDVRVWEGPDSPDAAQLAAFLGDATGLLGVAKDKVDATLLGRCPALRSIAIASTGYDSVDVAAVRSGGVQVTHTPAVLSGAVADHAFFLMTGARRRAQEHMTMFRTGAWDHHLALDELLGLDVHGQTLGLVGYGQVGKAIARRAVGYDMEVIEYSRGPHDANAQSVELDDLLSRADIVVLCLPLLPETYHLIGVAQLRSMKPTATLVNVGRGATLDQEALVVALREGWIHSAGIDVFETEPIADPAHPLLQLPNAFVTPHMASATLAARASMVSIAADDLAAMMQGRAPRHLIAELR